MELLFDLDGTLTDSATGITRCLQHAMLRMGHSPPPATELRQYIGPPLRATFRTLLATEEKGLLDDAIEHYRDRFATTGLYENEVYSDVPLALSVLRRAGHRLWVVTSKPGVYAQRIVEHFGLAPSFQRVYGSELSGALVDKTELVAHVVVREGLNPATTCMIGDRAQDMVAGRTNGMATIGALWGFGSKHELTEARADMLVDSMTALCKSVDGLSRSLANPLQ